MEQDDLTRMGTEDRRRDIVRVVTIVVIVRVDINVDVSRSEIPCGPIHPVVDVEPRSAEQRRRRTDDLLDRVARLPELLGEVIVIVEPRERDVVPGVVADDVTRRCRSLDEIRPLYRAGADHEERRPDLVIGEEVENLGG